MTTAITAFLYQIKSDGSNGEHWVIGDKPLVVGRGDCADACVDDDALSRSHFLIVREGLEFILVDLSSSNGTLVNGKRVSAHKLHAEETIRAGESAFCFSLKPRIPVQTPLSVLQQKPAASNVEFRAV